MLACANAAVVAGKVTETMSGFATTVATRKLGTKSRCRSAVAITSCCREWCPHAPSETPPASNENAPIATRRPPHRRRAPWRGFREFTVSRSTAGLSSRSRLVASFRSGMPELFIGEILEYAMSADAVVALAQHGKEIGDDQQGGGGRKQKAADDGPGQRRILVFAG